MQKVTDENGNADLCRKSINRLQRSIAEVKGAGMMDLKPKATDALDQAFRTIVLMHDETRVQAAQIERLMQANNDLVLEAGRRLSALEVSANAS